MDLSVIGDRANTITEAAPWTVLDRCRHLLEAAVRDARAGQTPGAAVTWLVDHFGFLRLTIRETRKMLPPRYYRGLPAEGEPIVGGRARARGRRRGAAPHVRMLARDLVARGVDQLGEDSIVAFFEEAQATRPLVLAELWAIAPMLRLALLERLHAELSRAESFDAPHTVRPELVEGRTGPLAQDRLVEGRTGPLAQDRPARPDGEARGDRPTIADIILALRALDKIRWRELTESVCALDRVLRRDPGGVYARMDFQTRDSYRRAVERIAHASAASREEEVAELAVDLAGQGDDERTRHVGYYLVGRGLPLLEERAGCRDTVRSRLAKAAHGMRGVAHLGGAAALTVAILLAARWWLSPVPWWYLALLAVAASEAALAVANGAAHARIAPTRLPRLDFSDGIPDDCRTLVVVPALLPSTRAIDALVQRLEVNFLANRDPNLLFALLTDAGDSVDETDDDTELGEACAESIRRLNEAYPERPFHLFHRARTWNPTERCWMGHERKRGKLNALNAWLLGGPNAFTITAGDLADRGSIRYVITLDADTQVPLDAARTLVATAAHPLNRPVFDPDTNVVREGYAILQPRVSVSAESAARSRLARIRGGATGVDPYATAVSDVYQDVHERANFTGKGLYDLAAYHRAIDGRFPDNALLSHDLIEGEHARVGLVSDVELVDDYPGSYEVFSKRKHRWTRGDWQLLYWLLPRVPDGTSAWVRNPLSRLSRWKIFDNLRRSTVEISVAVAIACAWLLLPGRAVRATAAVAGLLLAGAYSDLLFSLLRLPPLRLLRGFARDKALSLARAHLDMAISFAMTLHQALLMADAIARTLVRRLVTHRRLLQWETSAQAETAAGRHPSLSSRYVKVAPAIAALLVLASPAMRARATGLAVAALWAATPLIAAWLSRPGRRRFAWAASDAAFLRGLALRTWRHFDEWSDRASHWLVPDTVPGFAPGDWTDPRRGLAADGGSPIAAFQASPTNIGLQLAATVAAHDLGYLTQREAAESCGRVLDTIDQLERCRGHFYNWYDTRTLAPLAPRYVSTVDSGNLCASLLAVKQACLAARTHPVVGDGTLAGLRDHALRVRHSLPRRLRGRAVARTITDIVRRFEQQPADAFAWAHLVAAARPFAVAVNEWLQLAGRDRDDLAEASAWAARLVGRLDEAAREVRRFVPWADSPDRDQWPASIGTALGEVPSPAAAATHYDAIERRLREAPMSARVSWKITARLRRQIASARATAVDTDCALAAIAERCGRLAVEPDFRFLFDARRKLLRLGYDADTGALDESCYDLLASEARTAVLIAIAKRDIPAEAWAHLGRKLVPSGRDRVLVSWGGAMFEHLMPSLFTRSFDGSLLDASARGMVRLQQAWGRAHGVPWGFSEAAHATLEPSGRHAYQTFGVPIAAMRPMTAEELVVAPYASVLALMVDPAAAVENLRLMAAKGWMGRYGLYESADYTGPRSATRRRGTLVRCFMAHHQGMTMVALDNAVLGGRMQERFHADPLVAAAERLLQERLPTRLPAHELDIDAAAAVPARPRMHDTAPDADATRSRFDPTTSAESLRTGDRLSTNGVLVPVVPNVSADDRRPRVRRHRRRRPRVWQRWTEYRVESG